MSKRERTGIRNDGTEMSYGDTKPNREFKALTVGPQPKTGPLKLAAPQPIKKPQPKKATKK